MKLAIHIAAICTALTIAPAALAHAFLDHATPAVGGLVRGSPGRVELCFTAELEPAFSMVKVMDHNGKQVDKMDKALDRNDRTILRVSVPPLPAGTYRVMWRALSVDTHVTEGDFTFELAP